MSAEENRCRICGCTDDDCDNCYWKTGMPCHWTEPDLCSACASEPRGTDLGTHQSGVHIAATGQ